jgi:hypothetical protein
MKQKNNLKLIISILLLCIGINANAQSFVLHFATGSDIIPAKDIEKFIKSEKREFSCSDIISIYGYTDNVGSDVSNNILAEKRTNAVKLFIEEYFLKENNDDNLPSFALKNFGKQNPIAKNNTEKGREQNRRVEIVFSKKICEDDYRAIGNLFELIKDKPQSFCVNPLRDTALVGEQGTIVYYKAGTFKNTANCTCITILLNEYLDNASFILNNLTTTSNGEALESGGMTRLVGLCGDDTLQYNDGKYLVVMIPTDNALPNMKALTANRKDQADILDWKVDQNFPEMDIVDWNGLRIGCGYKRGDSLKDDCPLFLCKVRRFLKGRRTRAERKDDRENKLIDNEVNLIKGFNADKSLLGDALLKSKTASNALKYYVYKNASWDYHNCDRYKNGDKFSDFYVRETPKPSKDVKLVYVDNKTVVPGFANKSYVFKKVFAANKIWVVGLKYKDEQNAFLSLEMMNTDDKEAKLNFKEVSIDELKNVLKKINSSSINNKNRF